MDENKEAMPIPPKSNLFGDGDLSVKVAEAPESDFVMSFSNEAGDKAVVLTAIEVVGPDTIERHGRPELEDYAQHLMETGDDPFDLLIGEVFEGEDAAEKAAAEAIRLDEEFNPGEVDDKELIVAVDRLHDEGPVKVAEVEVEELPGSPVEGPDRPAVPFEDMEAEDEEEEGLPVGPAVGPEEEPVIEEIDVEEEPVLDQLRKAKKRP